MKKILLTAFTFLTVSLFAQAWEQVTNIPIGRHHPISFAIDGKGYSITGTTPDGNPTDDAYEYDPIADAWTTLSDFPGTARSFGIGTVVNDIAYLGFGATNTQYLRDLWSFDPATNTWTQLANCTCSGRRHPAMISIGTRIYVGLGDDATGNLNDFWMYEITTNTWSQIANIPGPVRHHPFMFNANNEVFAGLGHGDNSFGSVTIYDDWYKLDTTTNTWSTMNNFPGEARVAGTQFSIDTFGFVLSGDGDNHNFMNTGEMWRYDPRDDSWFQLVPHPGESRWAPGSFVIGYDVYFFGGQSRITGDFPNDMYKFSFPEPTSPPPPPTSIDEQILANTFVYPNPAKNVLLWQNDERITNVKVYNTLGQLVASSKAEVQKLDIDVLNGGLYLVQFSVNDEVVKTSKVVIQD